MSIFDPGNVKEYWIDGIAYYVEEKGIAKSGYFVKDPVLNLQGDNAGGVQMARLALILRCTAETRWRMREFVTLATRHVAACIVGASLLS